MDIVFATASQIARMIRDREISTLEVVNAHLTQIEKYNDKINAVVTWDAERAIERAKSADEALAKGENWGALHGVPITIKDTFEIKGLLTTAGYPPLKNHISSQDATVVARLRQAGAIILGKTNLPQLAGDYQTNNPIFGQTNNPWNLQRTAGGSSGGSASAIAAGFSSLELGSDIGGSIRLPSHYCGVCGFMPTEYRVSTTGHIPPLPKQPPYIRKMLRVGPIARSVEDLQLCFNLIAGADIQQPEIPPVALDKPTNKQLSELKIAWTYGYDFLPVSQDTRSCIRSLIDNLTAAGSNLTQCNPQNLDWSEILTDYGILSFLELFASTPSVKSLVGGLLFGLKTEYFARTQTHFKSGTPFAQKADRAFPPSLPKYKAILAKCDRTIAAMDLFMSQWDAWICPVSLTPAFPHCDFGQSIEVDGVKFPYLLACGGYTLPFDFTGSPVVVIPIGQSQSGLPIGVQIVGKRWHDNEILAIARQISEPIGTFPHPANFS